MLAGFSPPWCEDGCCDLPGPRVFGGVCEEDVEVEVEVGPRLELDEDDDEEDEDDDEDVDGDDEVVDVVVGAVVVVVVVGLGVQASDSCAIGAGTGSWIEDSGVPGGTMTLNVRVWPVTSVTVITQESADAVGSSAMPCTASSEPTVASTIVSFRRLNTLTSSSRSAACATGTDRDHAMPQKGRY